MQRLKRLTEAILDVAKIESQNLFLNKRAFNLKETLLHTVDDFQIQLKTEGKDNAIKLNFVSNDQLGDSFIVDGDSERMTRVISNILCNAIKFTVNGSINVMIRKEKNKYYAVDNRYTINGSDIKGDHEYNIICTILDTGPGIDASIIDKVFNKFETKSESGLGLGLYISKSIVEAHGGKIWAENNRNGKGATFSFSIPSSSSSKSDNQFN